MIIRAFPNKKTELQKTNPRTLYFEELELIKQSIDNKLFIKLHKSCSMLDSGAVTSISDLIYHSDDPVFTTNEIIYRLSVAKNKIDLHLIRASSLTILNTAINTSSLVTKIIAERKSLGLTIDSNNIIHDLYTNYSNELNNHINFEEKVLYNFVQKLLNGVYVETEKIFVLNHFSSNEK